MKNTILSTLLTQPWMIDLGYAMDAGNMVHQLIDPDHRKYTPRGEYGIQRIGLSMPGDDDDSFSSGKSEAIEENTIIAVIPLHGVMLKYGTLCTYGTAEIASFMLAAAADPRVGGLLIDCDTPGGEVASIPPLLEAMQEISKPKLFLSNICCSAGYYASLGSDYHMASNDLSALFGSIGVMMGFADIKPYWEKMGVVFHNIKPPESEDKNKAFELALEKKYELIIDEMLSPLAIRFQSDVRKFRPTLKEEPGVLTGKTFFATQAIEHGLIDAIGTRRDAINKLSMMIATKDFVTNNQ